MTNWKNELEKMFPRPYPVEVEPGEAPGPFDMRRKEQGRAMQVHICRAHFGELIIGAADTGLRVLPKRYFRDDFAHHRFPVRMGDSWRTRFDGGDIPGTNFPSTLVSLLFTEGDPYMTDHGAFTDIGMVYAKVVLRDQEEKDFYIRFFFPFSDKTLNDDGLELVRLVLLQLLNKKYLVEREEICEEIRESLDWATDHILDSFGQGKLPRKRK